MDYDDLAERWRSFDVSANIYQVNPDIEPLDDIYRLAQRVGLTPTAEYGWTEFGPLLELEVEPHVFTVYRASRAVQYIDSSRWQIDDGRSSMDVSDEDAFRAAARRIDRLGLREQHEFVPHKVTRLNVASSEKGGTRYPPRVIDVGVVFARVIDGLIVEGQGGTITVYLDTHLQMTGFDRIARRITGVHEPVRGWRMVDDVLAEVERDWNPRRDQGITVENVRLGYMELGRLQEQQYIQPVYVLNLRLTSAVHNELRTVEHYTPAAANGIGTVMPQEGGYRQLDLG